MRLVTALLSGALGCAHTPTQLTAYGYEHGSYALRIRYAEGTAFASSNWRIDNLQSRELGPVREKGGRDYTTVIELDYDNDGRVDHRERVPLHLLKLTHMTTPGVISMGQLRLDTRWRQLHLRALARMYVDALSGTEITFTTLTSTVARRSATRILEEEDLSFRGYEAYRVRFDVADVDQLQLEADARWRRVELVFVRPGFEWSSEQAWEGQRSLAAVLVLAHQNLPEEFDATQVDFERLMTAVDFMEEQLSGSRAALLACTSAEWASVWWGRDDNGARDVASPNSTDDVLECFSDRRPDHHACIRGSPNALPASPRTGGADTVRQRLSCARRNAGGGRGLGAR